MVKNPFVKASTKKKHLKISLYGGPGVGKTFFALGFPKPAVIDLEGGTDFYGDRFDFSVLDTKSFAEILDAVNFLGTGQHDFQTLVIDPITVVWSALQDGRLEFKAKDINKAVSGAEKTIFNVGDWGQIKRFYSMLMTKLVNLPMHVIMVGRMKDEYDGNGNEMVKKGVKMDAEKSTPYLPDIVFRLEVDKGKRVAIFEKDRSDHFPVGSRHEGLSYESFRPLVDQANKGQHQATHQGEDDAARKDAEFFQQQEHSQASKQAADKPRGNGDNGQQERGIHAPTLANLFTWFNGLDLPKGYDAKYKTYCHNKYGVKSMKDLSKGQLQEQRQILTNMMENEPIKVRFGEHLSILSSVDEEKSEMPVGNGREAGIRRIIMAKVHQIFSGNQEQIDGFFKELNTTVEYLDKLDYEGLDS
ncbi:MAG: ATP-binding protein, partial [Chloroflexota bacterium]